MRDYGTRTRHKPVIDNLNAILEAELSGVVRYTHYSLMVTGPNRIPLVDFLKAQATESLVHAQEVGEISQASEATPQQTSLQLKKPINIQFETSSERVWHTKKALFSFTENY